MEEPIQRRKEEPSGSETKKKEEIPPAGPLQAPPVPSVPGGRNKELEVAIKKALEGPSKDLGLLCKTLGEAFCLPSVPAPSQAQALPKVAGYDSSSSETTAPTELSSSGSEADVVVAAEVTTDDPDSGTRAGGSANDGIDGPPNATASSSEECGGHGHVVAVAEVAEIPVDLLANAWKELFLWRQTISEGDLLDVFNSMEGEWYLSKVVPLVPGAAGVSVSAGFQAKKVEGGVAEGSGKGNREGEKGARVVEEVRIHYQGWPNKYDETFPRDSSNLQPVHTHTKRLKRPDRKKKRPKELTEWIREDDFGNIVARGIVGVDDPYDEDEVANEEDQKEKEEQQGVHTNRYGRKVVPLVQLPTPNKGKSKKMSIGGVGNAEKGDGVNGEEEGGVAGDGDTEEKAKGKKRTNRTEAFPGDGGGAAASPDDWICATCWQLDTLCMSDMVTCDGPCLRSFHVVCLDMDEAALSEEKWLCEDCERGEHACWQCGDSGQDDGIGGVFRCSVNSCGKFYHRHCVELNANSNIKTDIDEGEDGQPVFKFRCGYHTCDTCSSKSGGNKNHLYKCFKCPTSYHINCIPPDARYHELALLCGAHPEDELPALKQEDSVLQRRGAAGAGGDEGIAPEAFSLPPLKLPRAPPRADQKNDWRHFRLPLSTLNSYHSKPPPFQHICAMQFIAPRPTRVDPTPVCNCGDGCCGDSCLNYMLRTECVCGNGIRGKYQNCKQSASCGNRRLQNRKIAKVAPFREYGMGWGLKVVEDVPKGSLVGEYVGEVIDEAMVEHRMAEQRRLRPNDGEFYIMELGQCLFVDAKEKGNLMRLINHSCNPNCDVQAWNIAGYTRLGIYAMKDLPKGESLSYDYKFSTNETARFKCMCGAENCRGTLAPKSREEEVTEDGSKLKGKARKEMLQKRERMAKHRQARSQIGQLVTSKRLSLTGRVLPGDRTAEVKAGPPAKYFEFARDQRIFLVRNARAGADLLTRKRLLVARAEVGRAKRAALAPSMAAAKDTSAIDNATKGTGTGNVEGVTASASAEQAAAAAAAVTSAGRGGIRSSRFAATAGAAAAAAGGGAATSTQTVATASGRSAAAKRGRPRSSTASPRREAQNPPVSSTAPVSEEVATNTTAATEAAATTLSKERTMPSKRTTPSPKRTPTKRTPPFKQRAPGSDPTPSNLTPPSKRALSPCPDSTPTNVTPSKRESTPTKPTSSKRTLTATPSSQHTPTAEEPLTPPMKRDSTINNSSSPTRHSSVGGAESRSGVVVAPAAAAAAETTTKTTTAEITTTASTMTMTMTSTASSPQRREGGVVVDGSSSPNTRDRSSEGDSASPHRQSSTKRGLGLGSSVFSPQGPACKASRWTQGEEVAAVAAERTVDGPP